MERLQVFISWSGERSLAVARAIKDWLPDVLRTSEPWLSSEDLRKGLQWNAELTRRLGSSAVGLVVLTDENKDAPWVLFEAGALSKALPGGRCCPILCGLKPTDLAGPLTQFQATTLARADMFRLVRTINEVSAEHAIEESRLQRWFDQAWPALESSIRNVLATRPDAHRKRSGGGGATDRALLEEVVGTLHRLSRDLAELQRDSISGALKGPLICSPNSLLARFSDLPLVEQERLLHRMAVAKDIIYESPASELRSTEKERSRLLQDDWTAERERQAAGGEFSPSALATGWTSEPGAIGGGSGAGA